MRALTNLGIPVACLLSLGPAGAHHSVPINFDLSREITVEGVLTEVKWMNPHSHFRMDVPGESGTTVQWLVEMGSVNAMKRSGFEQHHFTVGTRVAITGSPGRRDRVVLFGRALVYDGTEAICIARTSEC